MSNELTMCLVDTKDDIIICSNYCKNCLESKLKINVLKTFEISETKTRECVSNGCKLIKIKNCLCNPNPTKII